MLIVYGFLTARSQPVRRHVVRGDPPPLTSVVHRREMWSGFTVGLALIVLNPAAIVTWVVIMGSIIPDAVDDLDGVACALGVMVGSFALVLRSSRT